jgi:chromosome segregation ATPase
MDTYTLTNLTEPDIKVFTARGFVDDAVRASLEKILEIKSRLAVQEKRLAAIEQEKEQISDDQDRLRKNIEALKNTAEAKPLITRYVSKANDQETRIEQLTTDEKTAQAEHSRIQSELSVAISQLSLNKSL